MKNTVTTSAWRQYEAGRELLRRIGLYETVRQNDRFYRGEQWRAGEGRELPRPVFNIIRRIADYLISNVAENDLKITYSNDDPVAGIDTRGAAAMAAAIDALNRSTAYRWRREHMGELIYRLISDAAVSGDGIIYSYWDPDADGGRGGIASSTVDNTNIFVSDVNSRDIQGQEYLILAGRSTVSSLRAEARRRGLSESEAAKIVADGEGDAPELEDEGSEKATYLLKFYRVDGRVHFEKSTKSCVICRAELPCRLYPVAYFSWYPQKNSFHGTSPITSMIPNQRYINRAYAMVMKHMTDSAFSKVIYDRTRIPEWTNEVGEAIGAVGGGNIADAVAVVGCGKLESGYLDLISSAISTTKELAGATETALGNIAPNNASAILALREGASAALEQVRASLYRCIEETADIWADLTLGYAGDTLTLRTEAGCEQIDTSLIRRAVLSAHVEISETARYSLSATQTVLDSLLSAGHISFCEYLERLPDGILPGKEKLIAARRGDSGAPAETAAGTPSVAETPHENTEKKG